MSYPEFVLDRIPEISQKLEIMRKYEMDEYKGKPDSKTIFHQWKKLAEVGTMDALTLQFAFLGAVDKMRRFYDEARFSSFKNYMYSITALDYQAGLNMGVNEIKDNAKIDYLSKVKGLNRAARRLPPELIHGLLVNGTTDIGYDGVPFFSASHPVGMKPGTTFSNLTSGVLSEATLNAGDIAMQAFANDRGEILGLEPNLIVISPVLKQTAKKLFKSETTTAVSTVEGAGTINTVYGEYDYIVDPLLTDVNDWYMIHNESIQPFLYYIRQAEELEFDPGDRVKRKILYWSLSNRIAVGYGLPQTAIKFVNA
jgi:phage major head subunit gpT-like protein